ncbi:MAG: agmatine deiminase family protein [Elusimicrobiales bacterium]|nr:agmatine deiminase family protein [Elusimicrobiales bacterium]
MKNIFHLLAVAILGLSCAASAASPFDGAGFNLSVQAADLPAAPVPAAVENTSPEKAVPVHGYTPAERGAMNAHNEGLFRSYAKSIEFDGEETRERKYRPFADYEAPGYLIMSADFNFNSSQAKLLMASKLPADGTLVIFTDYDDAGTKENILRTYEKVVPRSRIKVIALAGAYQGFWARDGIPVPAIDKAGKLVVVDAVYGHRFEPDAQIAKLFGAGLEKHQYYYEGGNFMANHAGACIMVNHGAHTQIPDSVFTNQYGCSEMIRLPFVDGIGHIDEHVRFISEKVLVTDLPQYKDVLQGKGFTVHMLPKPSGPYETYVNSLIMNDQVIVPVFGRSTDAQALAVYERLGLKASGADSKALSNQGQGSVHCITMTYPKVPASALLKALGAREL